MKKRNLMILIAASLSLGIMTFIVTYFSEGDRIYYQAVSPSVAVPPTPSPLPKKIPAKVVEVKEEKLGEIVGTEITYANIFNGVNQERSSASLKILKHDLVLDRVANDKLKDMIKDNYFAHQNPITGATISYFMVQEHASYFTQKSGENLARFYLTVQDTIKGWMNSPTHKANILKEIYTRTGIALSGNLIVQVFSN